jgi:CelD/BcsL family acetyltransferase involved in cellulose biosynthesis
MWETTSQPGDSNSHPWRLDARGYDGSDALSICVDEDIDVEAWRAFIDTEPSANIFHTPEMTGVFARAPGHGAIPWAVQSSSGAIVALVVPVQITLASGPARMWTSRSVGYGGIARSDDDAGVQATACLLQRYVTGHPRGLLFTELRHQGDASPIRPALQEAGFLREPHLNYVIALDRAEDELWSSLSRSARQRIRGAEKKGVTVVAADDHATADAAYRMLADVYRRARVPLASPELFAAARAALAPSGSLRIVTAQVGRRVVAARFLLCFKTRILDWYAGSDRSFSSYSPNELLVWHTLRWGREHGYEEFDFGGAGRPDAPYGPRDFKAKFGGTLVEYGRDVLVHAPRRLRVSRTGYAAMRRLQRGRQP